jgi:AraC-like DNA-binding protein
MVMRPPSVHGKLSSIRDWPERAAQAGYKVKHLARLCLVDAKALLRFFDQRFGRSTRQQLEHFRQVEIEQLACNGLLAKQIAAELHFTSASDFSRRFRAAHAMPFRQWTRLARPVPGPQNVLSDSDNLFPLPIPAQDRKKIRPHKTSRSPDVISQPRTTTATQKHYETKHASLL